MDRQVLSNLQLQFGHVPNPPGTDGAEECEHGDTDGRFEFISNPETGELMIFLTAASGKRLPEDQSHLLLDERQLRQKIQSSNAPGFYATLLDVLLAEKKSRDGASVQNLHAAEAG